MSIETNVLAEETDNKQNYTATMLFGSYTPRLNPTQCSFFLPNQSVFKFFLFITLFSKHEVASMNFAVNIIKMI